jgi:hypothetical protein
MASQYLTLVEETTRGTTPAGPYLFLPVISDVMPEFDADDKPRVEFRGQDTGLGDVTVVRREVKWSMKIKCYYYPGKEVGLLFKHLFGNAGTRSVVDTSGYKGLLNPILMPYGTGMNLGDKAIAIIANTDEGGVTRAQTYGGGRITDCKITCKGTDDVELEFSIQGAWIGAADQTAIGGVSFPGANPFNSGEYKAYIGGTPVRTGTAPNYTDITIGTAVQFIPDQLDITISNGLKDKVVGNGVPGPSRTYREGKFKIDVNCPIDYEDPASGFSSADEFKKLFTGPATNNLVIVWDNGDLAGAATVHYTALLDLPYMMQKNPKKAERNAEGKTPSLKMGFESLFSATTSYPGALLTVDKATTY